MTNRRGSRIVPLTLGVAMLAVVLVAGLFPNAGTVQAQSSCPYTGCVTSSSVPIWEYASILVIVVLAAIVALLFVLRRRRPPRAAPNAPAAATGAAPAPLAPWAEGPPPTAPAPYIETPEDVGHPPPAVGAPSPSPAPPPPAAAAGAAEPASDIDSLMAELDKISTEILKKAPKKGADAKEGDEADAEGADKSS